MGSAGRRSLWAAVMCVGLLIAGCSGDDAPDDDATAPAKKSPSSSSASGTQSPGSVAEGVPVAGSFVVTGDQGFRVRVAVHAVRRVEGATIVDWSLTGIPSAEHPRGERVEGTDSDFGLSSGYGYHSMTLVDPATAKVYRPLIDDRDKPNPQCTCRAAYAAISGMVAGETAMVQLAFPELPAELSRVDVSPGSTPTIDDVPIAPIGQVPVSKAQVDLAAPEKAPQPDLGRTVAFDYPQSDDPKNDPPTSRLVAVVEEVRSSEKRTDLVWRLEAEEPSDDALQGWTVPVTDDALASTHVRYKATIASGPGLRPEGSDPATTPVLRASFSSIRARTVPMSEPAADLEWIQCRCTDYQGMDDALKEQDGALRLVTETGPLPAGTRTVAVTFPGGKVQPVEGVPVTSAESAPTTRFEEANAGTYDIDYETDIPQPLTLADWPTPLPSASALAQTQDVIVDDLLLNTTEPNLRSEDTTKKVELTLDTAVFFGPDSAKVRPAAQRAIQRIANRIGAEAAAGTEVTVVGHVAGTSAGSVAVQQRLSEQRATAVRRALEKSLGSADVTLTSEGRGAKEPVADNDSDRGREQNRRVVVTFQR